MTRLKWLAALILIIMFSLSGGALSGNLNVLPAANADESWNATLGGSPYHPAARGKATFGDSPAKNEFIFTVQLRDARELANSTVDVYIDGAPAATLKLDSKGSGALTMKTNGNDAFPVVDDGSPVEIRTQNGTPVVSGLGKTTRKPTIY